MESATNDSASTSRQTVSFRLGRIVTTPGALAAMERSGDDPLMYIARHGSGDWGDLDEEDRTLNDAAVAHEGDPDQQSRVLSAYRTKQNERIWLITEADRSSTCLLLPDEY